jgi:glycyl-tRNA synthetase alpha subunit
MKKLFFIITLLISFTSFSQKTVKDTNEICMPYTVAKKIALDLNRLDSITKVSKLTDIELIETRKKVDLKDSIITTFEQKETNYKLQIEKENEKFKIVDDQNKDLRKDIKKLKVKNTVIEIVGGSIITILSGVLIFK